MQGLIQQLTKMEIELNEHRYVFHVLLFCVYIMYVCYGIFGLQKGVDSTIVRENGKKYPKCGSKGCVVCECWTKSIA